MGGYIPDEKIEEIRSRADILEIVSEFVTLRKRGKSYTGLCPFHGEKTPSFTVNVDRQIFHCFGCGEGGNVIRFLMKINNLSFPEAVRSLAVKVGVDLPEREFRKERKEPGKREKLLQANRLAAGYFRDALNGPEGDRARTYLASRGIGAEALSRFSIGYARDGWHFLKDALGKEAVPAGIAEEAGLLVRKDRDWHYDRFRDRIMFPVLDLNGNVVAFGGRLLGNGEPKYLNSPETPVYTKGRVLYGLYDTKEDIRRADRAILVEGYMDLIALWEGGIRHVVASLGTALTREQVLILRRFTKNVVLLFDPDQAGRHAAERSLKLFLEEG
ncbi:MAG TPA: DNA primase, partial [Syntrophales bacterium]|nr:DNA primase [Syntrophales bacterium]